MKAWTNSELEMAVAQNRDALLRVVLSLYALARLNNDHKPQLTRSLKNTLLRIMRPAEAAARRLIVILARNLAVEVPQKSARAVGSKKRSGQAKSEIRTPKIRHSFRLYDAQKRYGHRPKIKYAKVAPRITFIGVPPLKHEAIPESGSISKDDAVDGAPIFARIGALKNALEKLPAHAKRLAKKEARRKAAAAGAWTPPPMRFGRPPGYRQRQTHEVDEILAECHWLARHALKHPT